MPSYHEFTLSRGRGSVERIYIPLEEAETREQAEQRLKRSQRRRILHYHLTRPSSYYRRVKI